MIKGKNGSSSCCLTYWEASLSNEFIAKWNASVYDKAIYDNKSVEQTKYVFSKGNDNDQCTKSY